MKLRIALTTVKELTQAVAKTKELTLKLVANQARVVELATRMAGSSTHKSGPITHVRKPSQAA